MLRSVQFVAFLLAAGVAPAFGQSPERSLHYFHAGHLPPGTVGLGQLQRDPRLVGYTQPVKLLLPEGARVSFLSGNESGEPEPGPLVVGMQVGSVYQLKVTSIPYELGAEVYPTIEIVNRTYPPAGQALRFPVPIELTQEELEYALGGRFVTRVIYLEDRGRAVPIADEPDQQRYFEVGPGLDPLRVADQLGRPVAILRMGSRVPEQFGAAPSQTHFPAPIVYPRTEIEAVDAATDTAVERHGANVPRIALPSSAPRRITQPAGLFVR